MHARFLILTIGAIVLGVVLLVHTVTKLIRLLRESVVVRLPALVEQSVEFDQAGTFILHVEHPRFTSALSRAGFALRDAGLGQDVKSWPIVVATTSSGLSTVRFPVRGFSVERPGRYKLSITGISAGSDTSKDVLIFMRPYGAAMVLLILGIILGGACFVVGLVFTALQLAGK